MADFQLSSNIHLSKEAVWDERQYRANYSSGSAGTNLLDFVASDYIPDRFLVVCGGLDDVTKRGLYLCLDKTNLNLTGSWEKQGSVPTTGSSVTSFNTRSGSVVLTFNDVTASLTYVPENPANKNVVNGYAGLDATGRILTGSVPLLASDYVASAGVVAVGDTHQRAIAKLDGNISALSGGVVYQGVWNATTNVPFLQSGVGTKGYLYKVSVSGSTNLDGITTWLANDSAVFNGTTWNKINGLTNEVVSVFGRSGVVTVRSGDFTTDVVNEGTTNLYFTNARVKAYGDTLYAPIASGSSYAHILSADVVSDLTVGAININQTIPSGSDLIYVVQKLLQKDFNPTINAPTFALSSDVNPLAEIGLSLNPTLTFTYNTGSVISGKDGRYIVPRGGAATSYTFYAFNGTTVLSTGGSNPSYILTNPTQNYTVIQGVSNGFKATVTYAAGPAVLTEKGSAFASALPSGTSALQPTSFEGVYPLYATSTSITTATKQSLVSMITSNYVNISLVGETGGSKQFFEVPQAWLSQGGRNLISIQHFNTFSNAFATDEQISTYTVSSVIENVNAGSVGIAYKRYTNNGPNRSSLTIRLIFG